MKDESEFVYERFDPSQIKCDSIPALRESTLQSGPDLSFFPGHFANVAIVGKVTFERKTAENTGKTSNIANIANFAKFSRRQGFFANWHHFV